MWNSNYFRLRASFHAGITYLQDPEFRLQIWYYIFNLFTEGLIYESERSNVASSYLMNAPLGGSPLDGSFIYVCVFLCSGNIRYQFQKWVGRWKHLLLEVMRQTRALSEEFLGQRWPLRRKCQKFFREMGYDRVLVAVFHVRQIG